MAENKYLNEEKYQQNVKKLKGTGKIVLTIGIVMLILGAVFLVLGFIGFGSAGLNITAGNEVEQAAKGAFGGFGLIALGGFLDTTGLFVTGIGGMLLILAHRREITAFTTQQVMPVAKEGIDEMAPTIGNAAGEIAKGIKKGLSDDEK